MRICKLVTAVGLVSALGISNGTAKDIRSAQGQEKITQLINQALPDLPGHNAIMVTVDFLPGQASNPHQHPGSVFVYVLEGSVFSELEGQKPVLYHKGQYWYEPPRVGHIICKNASDTVPAKLLVWQLLEDKEPIVMPFHP